MKYLCCNGHKFIHPAKLVYHDYSKTDETEQKIGAISIIEPLVIATEEYSVCPDCGVTAYIEYVEAEPEITSVKSVDLSQVDDYLKMGYVVRELYAKTATLCKMEAKA